MTNALLRPQDAAKYLAISKSTFWRWVKEEKLPQGIHLSGRCTVWRTADLDAFVELMAESTVSHNMKHAIASTNGCTTGCIDDTIAKSELLSSTDVHIQSSFNDDKAKTSQLSLS